MAEDYQKIIETLSPIERAILPLLPGELRELAEKSSMDESSVYRALNFLKSKDLIELKEDSKKVIELDINGIQYQKHNLPERRLLQTLEKEKELPIRQVAKKANLTDNEAKVSIGILKKKALIQISKGNVVLNASPAELMKKSLEETFLEKLPIKLDSLEPEEKFALDNLKSRKQIIEINEKKLIFAEPTSLGKEISKLNLNVDLIEQLTPKSIKSGDWKDKKFRRYDLNSQAPKVYGGKRHFVNQATDYAKSIWLEMGFKEMEGTKVQSGFWVFDALFTAQDHPVRDMQDTFFIKDAEAKLPAEELVNKVKKAHEGGVDGSAGWRTEWRKEDAKKVLLRTHTTALSAQYLKKIAETKEFPAKYFALGKCFRNETVDWSHGFEFNQTEGIVVDENANFRQLLGYLKQFFTKMGYEKIRIRPAYFPYTEPSLEIDAFHPTRKCWVELGGAGMFRPEVTVPIFGKHIPVLAWGPGFDRIIMEYFKILDLRDMYKNNITKLREMKFWRK
jgi:phenylalanyl-tRNA synthetase alpha chain